jgi:hypothetical protein
MKALSLFVLSTVVAVSATPSVAEARYYSREEVRTCRSDGQDVGVGALVGCGVGMGLSAILGNKKAGDLAASCVGGGVAGGLIGALGSMKCRDRVVYIDNVDRYLDDGRFERPYSWQGGYSVIVEKTIYRNDGSVCHVYKSSTPRGTYKEVACQSGRGWRHGYEESIVIRDGRSWGSWREGRYFEERNYDRSFEDRRYRDREEMVCVAENARGIRFRASGDPSFDDVERMAVRECRRSPETRNPNTCRLVKCKIR